jgi:hypothetical protein
LVRGKPSVAAPAHYGNKKRATRRFREKALVSTDMEQREERWAFADALSMAFCPF